MAWELKVSGAETGTGLTFGDLLRRHRASANFTQEDLAERTGLTPQAIGLLERGERRRPHAYTVRKLAEALELEGSDLAEFESVARRSSASRATAEKSRRALPAPLTPDRKSTRLNSSHANISYAVFCLKKKKNNL